MSEQSLIPFSRAELAGWQRHIYSVADNGSNKQIVFRFENDYGVSVIQGRAAYSDEHSFEVCVVRFSGNEWRITDAGVFDHDMVAGWQNSNDVLTWLILIQSLPVRVPQLEG